MPSHLQAQWSHIVSWTVRSCGIPRSPPLKKETLTSGSTTAQHSACTVLLRSGSRIQRLFLSAAQSHYLNWKLQSSIQWKITIELRLSLFGSIALYINILYIQYSLTTAIACT